MENDQQSLHHEMLSSMEVKLVAFDEDLSLDVAATVCRIQPPAC